MFTAGAALGLGFAAGGFSGAISSVVGGLGLSAPLAGALTGAITSAGFGGAAGFLLSGGKMKGLQKGALLGGVTGGVLGLAAPSMFNIGANGASTYVRGGASALGAGGGAGGGGNGLLPGSDILGTNSIGPGIADAGVTAPSVAAPAAASAAPSVAPAVTAAKAGGSGIMSGFFSNPTNTMIAGNLLSGLASPSEAGQAEKLKESEGQRLFSDIYSSGAADPGQADYGPGRVAVRPVRRYQFNPQTLKVEEVASA